MKVSLPSQIPEIRGREQDPEQILQHIIDYITNIRGEIGRALDGNLDMRNNIRGKYVTVTSHATPDTEFTVTHNFGRTPFMYFVNTDKSGIVYDSRRADWTTTEIFLKCSVASAALRIFVLG